MEESAGDRFDVFISYAEADRAWVDGFLIDGLERSGVRCHREAAFTLGVPRLAEFESAIRSSTRILLVLSPAYFSSETASFVDLLAQTYGLETTTWPVIPLRLEPVAMPTRLGMLTALDATDPDEREAVLRRLCDLFQRPSPAAPARPACPYPGMRPFSIDDGFPFFGRDRECEELLQHLRQSRFLTVIGGSGSGKSSLVFAGLVPRLRKSNLFGPGKWLIRSIRPGERPINELALALGADPSDPAAAVAEALKSDPEARRLLLIVDQFEEVFAADGGKTEPSSGTTLMISVGKEARDRSKSEEFCRALQGLLTVEGVSVVLTVRADFYAELMATRLWPQIKANRIDVGPLDEAGMREAIYRPAETVGVYVESALVERLGSDAVEARSLGILPLVQEVLVQLWEKLERRVLPLHAYAEFVLPRLVYGQQADGLERNGLEVAIARHADGVLKRLEADDPAQVEVARRIFVRLVQFGEGRPDTRRQQAVAQLRAGNDPVRFETTLRALVGNRLITLSADRETGRRRADIAHEALIRGWPGLQHWIEESRKAEEVRRKLERKAQEWVEAGAANEGLLGRSGLVEAEAFLDSPDGRDLPDDDPIRRLIRESSAALHSAEIEREAARRRELAHARQRVKILIHSAVVLGVLLVGLLGLAVYAFEKRGEAQAFAADSRRNLEIANANERKAKASATEARTSEARAKERTVEVLINSGVDAIASGSNSAALALFTRALGLQEDSSRDQMFTRQRLGFLGQVIPRLTQILPHAASVNSAVFSPDGKRIVSAEWDHTARVWETRSGRLIAELKGHTNWVNRAAFSPDGLRVVTASKDGTARVWDADSGRSIAELKGHTATLNSATFSPDGKRVLTASADHSARTWDASSGRVILVLEGHKGDLWSAVYSPNGSRIVTASSDQTAWVWDAESGKIVAELEGHTNVVTSAQFSPDGTRVVTASNDRTAKVWDARSGKIIADLKGHDDPVLSVGFSPDGTRVLTASQDASARIWEASSGRTLSILKGHTGLIFSASYSRDGSRVVTASADMTARIWDPDSGKTLADVTGHNSMVNAASFSPDGSLLLTTSDNTSRIWEILPRTSVIALTEHKGTVTSAGFSPDGTRLVTSSFDTTARIWDSRSGRTILVLQGHNGPVNWAAFSPDGSRVATASDDRTARVWDARSGATIAVLQGHTGILGSVAFSPDGTRIVTSSYDLTARVWDARSGRSLLVLHGHEANLNSAIYSPDGVSILTAAMDGTVRLWDSATGRESNRLGQSMLPVVAAAFSPDGKRIVTAGYSGTSRTWDFATLTPIALFKGHEGVVYSARFDPAGDRVITSCGDHTARVWDATSGQLIAELTGHAATVFSAAFSPDGHRICTASEDRTARIWSLDPIDGDARMIPLWAEVLTGTNLEVVGENGLTATEWNDRKRRLKARGDRVPPIRGLSDAEP